MRQDMLNKIEKRINTNKIPFFYSYKGKIIIYAIIVMIITSFSLYFFSRGIVLSGYEKLENNNVEVNVKNIISNIDQNINSLDTLVSDWANWDDTHRFIDDLNPEYIKSNLIDETFQGININVMMFIRTDGSIVYEKAYNTKEQKEIPIYPELLELLKKNTQIITHRTEESVKKGIILLNNIPMAIVSRPILTSERKGPITGSLIMGRFIDFESFIKQVHLVGCQDARVIQMDSTEIPEDIKARLSNKDKSESIYIKPVDNYLITGYTVIKDIQNRPAFALKIVMNRNVYRQGIIASNYMFLLLIVFSLIFVFISFYMINRYLLKPLNSINNDIREIGISSDLSRRITYSGKDEFSNLSNQFNYMMDSLEVSQNLLRESERKYSDLYKKMSEGVYRTTPQGEILSANPALREMLGYDEDEIYKISIEDTAYVNPRDRKIWQKQIEEKGETRGIELSLKRKDGQRITVLENSWVVRDSAGKVLYYEGTMVDITERKRATEELNRMVKYREVVQDISTSFVSAPSDKIDEVINNSLSKIGEFSGVDRSYLFIFLEDRLNINNTHEWCREGIDKAIHLNKDIPTRLLSFSMDKLIRLENVVIDDINHIPPEAQNEKYLWVSQDKKSILLVPVQFTGKVIGFIGFDSVRYLRKWQPTDIDILKIVGEIFGYALNRKITETELKFLSLHDSLTGLYNRTYYDEETQRLKKGRMAKVSIIICDLDALKLTNDTVGHKAGDILIKKAAQALRMSFRKEDVVARIGGDEFAVLLPNCDKVSAEKACVRLRESVEKINREKFILPLSISVGYASREDTTISMEDLFKLADEMMYQDKKSHIETIYPLIRQALSKITMDDIKNF